MLYFVLYILSTSSKLAN